MYLILKEGEFYALTNIYYYPDAKWNPILINEKTADFIISIISNPTAQYFLLKAGDIHIK